MDRWWAYRQTFEIGFIKSTNNTDIVCVYDSVGNNICEVRTWLGQYQSVFNEFTPDYNCLNNSEILRMCESTFVHNGSPHS